MQLLRASARRQFESARRQIETGLFFSFKPLSILLQVCLGTPFEFVSTLDRDFFSETTNTDNKWKLDTNARLPR